MRRPARPLRRLLLLGTALAVPLAAWAQTEAEEERDRGFLAGLIEDRLSSAAQRVTIDGFEGALSSRATVARLAIADADGVWLEATDLALDWNRSALLRGRVEVAELSAGTIRVLRRPLPAGGAPSPEATPFALPDLPVSVEVGALSAGRIELGEPVFGQALALTLEGAVDLEGGEGTTDLTAEIVEGTAGSLALRGAYSNATRVLELDLALEEAADGLVANALNLPGLPAVALTLDGTGPIDDYGATFSLSTDGAERVAGTFGVAAAGDTAGAADRAFGLDVRGDVTPLVAPELGAFFGPDVSLVVEGTRRGDGALSLSALEVATEALDLRGEAEVTAEGWPSRLRLEGRIGSEGAAPVTLPGAGGATVGEVVLDVTYDGAAGDAWTGTFEIADLLASGTRVPSLSLDGRGTIVPATDDAPGRFTGDLAYAARGLAFADPALQEAVGADVSGQVSLARTDGAGEDGGGPLRIRSLTLDGPGVEATAEGTLEGPDAGWRLRSSLMLMADDLGRFAALSGLDLRGAADVTVVSSVRPLDGIFDLVLTGTTRDLAVGVAELDPLLAGEGEVTVAAARDTAGTRVETLSVATDAARIAASADLTSGESRAAFDVSLADLALSFPDLPGPARARGTATRDSVGQLVLDAEADLPGAALTLRASQAAGPGGGPEDEATGAVAPGPVNLALDAEAEELADWRAVLDRLAPGLPVTPSGRAALTVAGTREGSGQAFDLALTARTRDLALGAARLDPLLAGEGALDGRVVRTGPLAFRVEGLDLATDRVTLTADGALEGAGAEGTIDLAVTDVAGVLPGLAGPATLRGDVGRRDDGTLDVDLAATIPEGSARLAGTVAPPAAGLAFEGAASADLPDLAVLSPFVGRDLGGAVEGMVMGTARPDLTSLDLEVNARTRDLRVGVAQLEPLLAGEGSLRGRVERSEGAGLALDLTAATPLLDATVAGTLSGTTGSARFDARLADVAPLAPGLSGPATATGTAARRPDGGLDLDADLTGPGTAARLDATVAPPERGSEVTGTVEAQVADLAPFSRLAGRPLRGAVDATVTGRGRPDLTSFDLRVDAATRDLDPGSPAAARLLAGAGTVAGRVQRAGAAVRVDDLRARFPNLAVDADVAEGEGGGGTATFDARLADVALFAPGFPGPATARGTATLSPTGRYQVDAEVTGPGGIGARVTGGAGGGPPDLRAVGRAPLGLANAFVAPRDLAGEAAFDLRLQGGYALADLAGTVSVAGARLADPRLGDAIGGIAGTATLSGGTARLDLRGEVLDGGALALRGPVGLGPPFEADLALDAANVVVRQPSLYEATASGALTIAGPLAGGARIAGAVDVAGAEIRVPSSGIGPLGDLPAVRHVRPSAAVAETLRRAGLGADGAPAAAGGTGGGTGGGGGAGYALDLAVRAPARVFVRGRGLDAELGGALRLLGTTAQVIPQGQFDLLRGRLDILGQRFTLTEGSAALQGDFVPFLRLVAETTARTGTLVSIILEGPAVAPEITFASVPELPQDEVLAQLLFGVSLASITPFQAVQLASAVATLAGRGGGLVDSLRGGLGLADLDVTTDASGGAALRLGRYLGENLYTDVTVGTEETDVTINLDLSPDLTVRAGVSSGGETSLGIEFARDY